MAKHIGIVSVSSEGAALCYQTICSEAGARMGVHRHPEISMHAFPLADYVQFANARDWQGVADLLLLSVEKVAAVVLDEFAQRFPICVAGHGLECGKLQSLAVLDPELQEGPSQLFQHVHQLLIAARRRRPGLGGVNDSCHDGLEAILE